MLRELARQSSWYLIVHFLGTLLTLLRVPIWTRYFSVEEYGWFSLVTATVSFVGPITRFGLPRSALRFFSEFDGTDKKTSLSRFYTTFFLGCVVLSGLAGLVFFAVIVVLGPERVGGPYVYDLYKLSSVLIIVGSIPTMYFAFLRVEQKAKLFAWLGLGRQGIAFSINLILMFVFFAGLKELYIAAIWVLVIVGILVIVTLRKQKKLMMSAFSKDLLMDGLRFGLPLVPAAMANVLSGIGDRYVLQYFMGSEAVGLYSAGYGVTTQLKALLTVMMFALTPMYLAIWKEKGRKATEAFLSSVLDYYLMIAIPAIFMFSVYGGDILILLASSKYDAARVIVPYLAAPLVLHGGITIYTAGLYIHKKTKYILYFTLGAGILNVILNIIMVPYMGLIGAALATLISYIFLIAFANALSAKFLSIRIDFVTLVRSIGVSIAVLILLHFINIDAIWGVLIKLSVGVLFYGAVMLLLDEHLREKLKMVLRAA